MASLGIGAIQTQERNKREAGSLLPLMVKLGLGGERSALVFLLREDRVVRKKTGLQGRISGPFKSGNGGRKKNQGGQDGNRRSHLALFKAF